MTYEIDHLFVCASVGAPEADLLVKFGLTEGSPNLHPGQGTANRRFFFQNSMFELLWVSNPNEARGDIAGRRPDAVESNRQEPLEHPIGFSELTGIHIVAASLNELSSNAECVFQTGLISMTPGKEPLLELTFDSNRGGRQEDFRPELPVLFRW